MPKLVLVTGNLPEPPYPADTRSRDWRFTINLEQVHHSDTWLVCPPEIRPWLWALWIESWCCTPCGSYPNDDTIIAARIGMSLNLFRAHSEVLLRGWKLHSDGRLYHPIVTEKVIEMLGWRATTTERVRKWREQQAAKKQQAAKVVAQSIQTLADDVTRYEHVGNTGETAPSPSPSPSPSPLKSKDEHASACLSSSAEKTADDDLELELVPSAEPRIPDCPHEAIVQAYHTAMPTAPEVERWGENRQRMLRQRWRETAEHEHKHGRPWLKQGDGVAWFRNFFLFCARSKFLTGRVNGRDGSPPFEASLEWLLKPGNFVRVIEGDFHREGG